MKKTLPVFALVLGFCFPSLLHAQFRGGGRSFGPRGGGMVRGFSGFRSAPAPFRTAPAPRFRGSGFSGFSAGWSGFGRRPAPSHGGFFGRRGPAFRRRVLTPFSAYPAYYPFFFPSPLSYVGFGDDYGASEEPQAAEAPEEDDALVSQVQALTDEVAEMRDEQAAGGPPPPAAAQAPVEDEIVPAVLVYRDGHHLEARNYAIYGQSVWVFGKGTTHKVPLTDLDLDATRKLNDQRGVSFALPANP